MINKYLIYLRKTGILKDSLYINLDFFFLGNSSYLYAFGKYCAYASFAAEDITYTERGLAG